MKTKVFAFLTALFSKKLLIVLVAALPIFELRLAIPLGIIKFNLPLLEVYFLSLIGNLIPIVPLLLLFKYFFHHLENIKFIGKFFSWWFRRVEQKSKIVDKWGFWGLVLFVSIPLPITGAWTGTVAATLFEMKTKKAALAIAIGVALAGLIVTVLSLLCADSVRGWLTFI
ncbi:MAG: small multi-drug export protein [Candidatus Omnitrophica bacterium]|nr:small multi-drug export protein [Candidatus Omnitrophota bacterium]